MKKTVLPPAGERRNLVAKHAHKANRAAAFEDRGRYKRKTKHKGREPFPVCDVAEARAAEKAGLH